jgi:hypothetical protein
MKSTQAGVRGILEKLYKYRWHHNKDLLGMAKKKISWQSGDVFSVKLKDGTYAIGQILDLQMNNVVRCAFFDERNKNQQKANMSCNINNLISLVATTREQLDFGIWKISGNKKIEIPVSNYPNEKFRNNGWIGAKVYDAAVIEEFLDAFYTLVPWDDWADPNYLDKLLLDKTKKPNKLIHIKK